MSATEMNEHFYTHEYAAKLSYYAFGICGDIELAKDTVQDVFLEYFKNPPRKNVSSWFYMVCKNKLLNKIMREKRKADAPEGFFERVVCDRKTPAAEMENSEKFEKLNESLAQLPPDQREAITLKYFENFSYQEIAKIMGTSANNVGNIIFRGMGKLKKVMQGE